MFKSKKYIAEVKKLVEAGADDMLVDAYIYGLMDKVSRKTYKKLHELNAR